MGRCLRVKIPSRRSRKTCHFFGGGRIDISSFSYDFDSHDVLYMKGWELRNIPRNTALNTNFPVRGTSEKNTPIYVRVYIYTYVCM